MAFEDLSSISGAGTGGITISGGGGGGGIDYIDVTTGYKVEYKTLSLQDILDELVTLNNVPSFPNKVILTIMNGIVCEYGEDFTVDQPSSELRWSGLSLSGKLEAGDTLQIKYFME